MRPLFPGDYYPPGVFMADSLQREKSSPLLVLVVTAAVKAIINHRLPFVDVCLKHSAAKRSRSRAFPRRAQCVAGPAGTSGKSKRVWPLLISHRPTWNMISVAPRHPRALFAIPDLRGGAGTSPWNTVVRGRNASYNAKNNVSPIYKARNRLFNDAFPRNNIPLTHAEFARRS